MNPHAGRACALACLPSALALILTGLLPARAAARGMSDVEQRIRAAARGPYLRLTLVDGRQVVGTYQGFIGDWSDSVASSIRYERWRSANAPTVPRIGDPLTIVASGDTLRGSLWGFVPSAVLLGHPDAAVASSIPFATISAWLPKDSVYDASWTTVGERVRDAPSVAGVALDQGPRRRVVTREQIVTVDGPTTHAHVNNDMAPAIVAGLIAGAIGAVVICAVVANDVSHDLSTCSIQLSSPNDAEFARARLSAGTVAWRRGETRRP